jgi:S-DNA-T family DNA segregation ATPase FtsK/SpoIIIE
VACLDPAAEVAAARLAAELPDAECYGPEDVPAMFDELRPGSHPHYVAVYAPDSVPGARDGMRTLLMTGPELRVHVLGWWRSVAGLLDDLGGPQARTDPIGAWVALDVPGADLEPLTEPGGPAWSPRRRRALFFDRSVHRTPEVLIPYEVNSDHT